MRFLPHPATGIFVERAVDDARCAELLASLGSFVPTGERYPRDYRNNDRIVFDDPELAAALYAQLGAHVPRELAIAGERWELCGFNPRFRGCRYRDGQAFCIHRDGPHVPSDDVRSHLTVQLYLDDAPAAGGRTRFYADAAGKELLAAIVPRRGAAIVFDHAVWHDGEAVTAGEKHVLRTDAMYRRVAAVPRVVPGLVGMHRGYAWRVIACRDGSLASSGRDGTVRRWSDPPRTIDRLSASPFGDAARPGRVGPFDLGAGSVIALAEDSRGTLWCGTRSGAIFAGTVRIADDVGATLDACAVGDRVVFATSRGTLVLADAWTAQAHDGWAWCVRDVDGATVASCGEDGRIAVTDRGGGTRTFAELGVPLRALVRLPDGWLAGDTRGWLHRLDRAGDTVSATRAHAAAITALAVASDGSWVSASEDGRVLQWRDGRCTTIASSSDYVTSLAIAGDRIACAGYDGAIRLIEK